MNTRTPALIACTLVLSGCGMFGGSSSQPEPVAERQTPTNEPVPSDIAALQQSEQSTPPPPAPSRAEPVRSQTPPPAAAQAQPTQGETPTLSDRPAQTTLETEITYDAPTQPAWYINEPIIESDQVTVAVFADGYTVREARQLAIDKADFEFVRHLGTSPSDKQYVNYSVVPVGSQFRFYLLATGVR